MFAVICWNSKNGVALDSEELEVQSSSKYVLMNGGKQEVGAAVNMVFRKDIWGGIIQSIHGSYIIVLRTHSFPLVYGIPVHTIYVFFFCLKCI